MGNRPVGHLNKSVFLPHRHHAALEASPTGWAPKGGPGSHTLLSFDERSRTRYPAKPGGSQPRIGRT
jgi:hypothetical protein